MVSHLIILLSTHNSFWLTLFTPSNPIRLIQMMRLAQMARVDGILSMM